MITEKLKQTKQIISTHIFLSGSHGSTWIDAEEYAEELLQNNKSKFFNLNFYERHGLIKKLLKNEGVS